MKTIDDFASLHRADDPLVLFNVWDAGSAAAVAEAGAKAIAIAMEIGIHNGTLAIALALSPALLNNPTMAIPAAIYSLIMFVTAALFGLWVNRVHGAELVEPLAQGDGA